MLFTESFEYRANYKVCAYKCDHPWRNLPFCGWRILSTKTNFTINGPCLDWPSSMIALAIIVRERRYGHKVSSYFDNCILINFIASKFTSEFCWFSVSSELTGVVSSPLKHEKSQWQIQWDLILSAFTPVSIGVVLIDPKIIKRKISRCIYLDYLTYFDDL